MKDIAYKAPRSLKEAIAILQEHVGRARVLAGGTDILVQIREGARDADVLVDIKRIGELTEIRQLPSGGWSIGAAAPCHVIEQHSDLRRHYPALTDAVRIIGGWQIKNRATVGGNLCNSSPAADSVPALLVHDASVRIVGSEGERRVSVEDFCTAPGKNILGSDEIVASFEFAAAKVQSGSYLRFIPRYEMDIAVVGAGVCLSVENGLVRSARIALGAVAPRAILAEEAAEWLVGNPANEDSFATAGDLARAIASPITDMRGPAEYRTHVAGVLVKRALAIAMRRWNGEMVDPLKDGHF